MANWPWAREIGRRPKTPTRSQVELPRRLIAGARTRLTKLGEVLLTADISVRRAMALTSLGAFDRAIEVLIANRAKLATNTSTVRPDRSDMSAATVHVAACDYGAFAIVTGPDGHNTGFRTPLSSTEIKGALASILASPTAHERETHLDTLNELLRVNLVEPINLLIDEMPGLTDLRIVAAGSLTSCPLSAVPDGDNRTWLDQWNIHHLVSTWPGEDQPLPRDPATIAVINPDNTLVFAESEAESITAITRNVATAPSDWSTRDWLMNQLPAATVAHLACHASLDPSDPTKSAFHLGESGDVTVDELARLDLGGLQLAVAPACQSAASNPSAPDELLGVGHALLHAGATGVIASLWDADDDATALVIARLYHELGNGLAPGQALARAQTFARSATATSLIEIAYQRLAGASEAAWLPHRLAIEFTARSAHPDLGKPDQRWFAHPARWAALSYVRN